MTTGTLKSDKKHLKNEKIIIKKSISKIGILCAIYIAIALYLSFINGNGSNSYIIRKGRAIGGIFLLLFIIMFIYNVITFKFKYITIDANGFNDNISILFPEMYQWHKIKNIELKNSEIILTTQFERKRFGFMHINKDELDNIHKFISLYLTK